MQSLLRHFQLAIFLLRVKQFTKPNQIIVVHLLNKMIVQFDYFFSISIFLKSIFIEVILVVVVIVVLLASIIAVESII